MSVVQEIERSVRNLGLLPDACSRLAATDSGAALASILERFTGGVRDGWWWERLVGDPVYWQAVDGLGFERVVEVVPDSQATVCMVVDADDAFEVFVTTPAVAVQVLGECYAFEYFIVPHDLSWLLGENHHDVLVGVGEPVATRLAMLAS